MKTIDISFKLSQEAFDFLCELENIQWVEYRDAHIISLEYFLISDEYLINGKTQAWYMSRNHNGTLHLIHELDSHNLVESDNMSWHQTYHITEFGREIVQRYKYVPTKENPHNKNKIY